MRYFVAVAEELHFGRAAQRLHIAQPPLSQQIAGLEREIGVELFDRSGRRTKLTHAGGAFLPEARTTLQQADRAVLVAQQAHRGEIGNLSLGFVGSATYQALPVLLKAFRREHPEVRLSLQTLTTKMQLSAFEERSIEIGLLRPPVPEWLSTRLLLEEPLIAVLPEDHPSAEKDLVPLSDLSDERFILWPRSSGARIFDEIVAFCHKAGFVPDIVEESTELQTMVGLVASGMGVSLQIANPDLLHSLGVVYRAVDDPEARWAMAVAWERGESSPVVEAFLQTVEENADFLNSQEVEGR